MKGDFAGHDICRACGTWIVLNQELEGNPRYPCKVGGVLKEGSAH